MLTKKTTPATPEPPSATEVVNDVPTSVPVVADETPTSDTSVPTQDVKSPTPLTEPTSPLTQTRMKPRKKRSSSVAQESFSPSVVTETSSPQTEKIIETSSLIEETPAAASKYTVAVGGNLVLQKFKLESATDNVNIPNVTSLNLVGEFYYHHNSKHTFFAAVNYNPIKMDVNYDNVNYSPSYKRSQLDAGYLYSLTPSWSLGGILNYQASSFLYPSILDLTTLEYSTLRPFLQLGYKVIGLGNHGISTGLAVAPHSVILSKENRVKSLKSPFIYKVNAEYAYGLTSNTKISLFGSYHIENLKFNYDDGAFTEDGIDFKTQYFDIGAKLYYDF